MTILVDTNVILDMLLKREPYRVTAQTIITKCTEVHKELVRYFSYFMSRVKAVEPDEFVKLL